MPRPKPLHKPSEKISSNATLEMDIQSYKSTRNQMVQGLNTLQEMIKSLTESYVRITNAVLLGYGDDNLIDRDALQRLADNPLLKDLTSNATAGASSSAAVAAAPGHEHDKVQRRKRVQDPNAPKRPLTAFFLYMKTARPIIAKEMGEDTKPKDVSDEGTLRWAAMSPNAKGVWQSYYRDNLRLYNARVHAYAKGAGDINAKDMTDEEALVYADAHNIPADNPDAQLSTENEAAVLAAASATNDDDDVDVDSESEREPTPAPATPKKSVKKGKARSDRDGEKEKEKESARDVAPTSIVPPGRDRSGEKEKTSERKRKRSSMTGNAVKEKEREKDSEILETPRSVPKSKKRKGRE